MAGALRAVLFDLDNTLLDRRASLDAFVSWQAWQQLGLRDASADRFVRRFVELDAGGRVWKDVVYRTLIAEMPELAGRSADVLLASYESDFRSWVCPRPGALGTVRALASAGLALGLVSNGRSPFQERNFEALGVTPLFGAMLVSEAEGLRKPDARLFRDACRRLGAAPERSVFVGDDPDADIRGARAAGLRTIHVPFDGSGSDAPEADHTTRDLAAVSGIVLRDLAASG